MQQTLQKLLVNKKNNPSNLNIIDFSFRLGDYVADAAASAAKAGQGAAAEAAKVTKEYAAAGAQKTQEAYNDYVRSRNFCQISMNLY